MLAGALHGSINGSGTGPFSFGVGSTSSSLGSTAGSWSAQGAAGVDWDAVWNAAKAYDTRDEFISAMNLLADADDGTEASGSGTTTAASCPPPKECPSCPSTAPCPSAEPCPSSSPCPSCPAASPCPSCPACPAANATAAAGGAAAAAALRTIDTTTTSTSSSSSSSPVASGVSWTSFVTDGQAPLISRELAHSVAQDGAIIVTWANYALWDFVQTWVFHLRRQGLTNYMVGAMDEQIGTALVAAGMPCFAMFERANSSSSSSSNSSARVGADHLQWGGEAFHKMGRMKITLAQLFLSLDLDLLLVDADAIVVGDVMSYFRRYPEADILVTSDQLASTIPPGDDGLEDPSKAHSPMNIGFMFFRRSNRTLSFVQQWLDVINADPKYWDQNAFNDLARSGWDPVNKLHPNNPRVFMGANGTLGVGVLPVASFSGGHTFYVQRLYEVQRVQPYAVHCTFQYGANPGKRNRLREAQLFYDPPEYYAGDSYVSVDVRRVPSATWQDFQTRNASSMKAYHFRGLFMQLQSVWPAVRTAAVFNRSLIVPKLACYCDKYWTELDKCRVPGAFQERIPFLCPMDHVLDPFFFGDPASPFNLRWREHSFLDNPRCPEDVKRSRVTFYNSPTATKPIEKWVVQEGGLVVVLPTNLTETALREALQPYAGYKVWHLKDPEAFFGGFDNKTLEAEVSRRIEHLMPVVPPDPSPPPPPANATAPATDAAAAAGAVGANTSTTTSSTNTTTTTAAAAVPAVAGTASTGTATAPAADKVGTEITGGSNDTANAAAAAAAGAGAGAGTAGADGAASAGGAAADGTGANATAANPAAGGGTGSGASAGNTITGDGAAGAASGGSGAAGGAADATAGTVGAAGSAAGGTLGGGAAGGGATGSTSGAANSSSGTSTSTSGDAAGAGAGAGTGTGAATSGSGVDGATGASGAGGSAGGQQQQPGAAAAGTSSTDSSSTTATNTAA